MGNKLHLAIDAAVTGGLLFVLLAVAGVDGLLTLLNPRDPSNTPGLNVGAPSPSPSPVRKLRLAVSQPFFDKNLGTAWDDVGVVLTALGDGYAFDQLGNDDLANGKRLNKYDVVFFSCGVSNTPGLSGRLKDYVAQGGTLYASDWRYDTVAEAFSDLRAPQLAKEGNLGRVVADVVDPGLRDVLGPKITLNFDLSKWKTAAFGGSRVKVLLRGQFANMQNVVEEAPLLVKFPFGKGNVIFTSYHHGKHMDEQERKLLKYLVLSVVTAKLEQEIESVQVSNQFSPAKSNLFSASQGAPSAAYVYDNPKAGTLRFDLGFEDRGAVLKLTVTTPGGKKLEKQGTASLNVIVPDAAMGKYTYTITAVQVPFENFPFLVNVSHGK